MKKLNLKNLNLAQDDLLPREQLMTVFGGYGLMCYNEISYDDGYWYVANQGSDIDTCRSIVGTSYTDSHGTFTVNNCFCTSYA